MARLNKQVVEQAKERQQQIVNAQTLKMLKIQQVNQAQVQPQQEIAEVEVQAVQNQIKKQPIGTN